MRHLKLYENDTRIRVGDIVKSAKIPGFYFEVYDISPTKYSTFNIKNPYHYAVFNDYDIEKLDDWEIDAIKYNI